MQELAEFDRTKTLGHEAITHRDRGYRGLASRLLRFYEWWPAGGKSGPLFVSCEMGLIAWEPRTWAAKT
jgi:hypothetical protein